MFQNFIHTYPMEGHWKFQGGRKSLENQNFKWKVQLSTEFLEGGSHKNAYQGRSLNIF